MVDWRTLTLITASSSEIHEYFNKLWFIIQIVIYNLISSASVIHSLMALSLPEVVPRTAALRKWRCLLYAEPLDYPSSPHPAPSSIKCDWKLHNLLLICWVCCGCNENRNYYASSRNQPHISCILASALTITPPRLPEVTTLPILIRL